jgi:hypothetical protein
MGKVALVAPAGTVTLGGRTATGLVLARATTAPPAGAGPVRITFPVEDPHPPAKVAGERTRSLRAAPAGVEYRRTSRSLSVPLPEKPPTQKDPLPFDAMA